MESSNFLLTLSLTLLGLTAMASLTLVLWIVKTEPNRTAQIVNPLSKQLDETVRLLASKDALAYGEIKYAQQRESQISEYEQNARYYTGDTYAAEEARLSGELEEAIAIDKEDLDAITAAIR